jgi:hypothetical protein
MPPIGDSNDAHRDCMGQRGAANGQRGAAMILEERAVISSSNKQKINMRNEFESKIEGIDNACKTILWSLYFVEEEDIDTKNTLLYEDNRIIILIENNDKTKHQAKRSHKGHIFFHQQN